MLSFFLGSIVFLLTLIVMTISIGIIGIVIVFVGYILEKAKEKDDGFFHKLLDAIDF